MTVRLEKFLYCIDLLSLTELRNYPVAMGNWP